MKVLGLPGGSWVVTSGATGRPLWVITRDTRLIAPLTTTHEAPSMVGDGWACKPRIPPTAGFCNATGVPRWPAQSLSLSREGGV